MRMFASRLMVVLGLTFAIFSACASAPTATPGPKRSSLTTDYAVPEREAPVEAESSPQVENLPAEPVNEDAGSAPLTQAPRFSIAAVNAPTAEIQAGRVNVVAFGASWCQPCVKLFPSLQALFTKHRSRLAVVAIEQDSDARDVTTFIKPLHLTFPVAWDRDSAVASSFQLNVLPSIYLVDKRGSIRFVHAGYQDADDAMISKEVNLLLNEP
jgi:thiol-disulfide isomerase/thioredoxin